MKFGLESLIKASWAVSQELKNLGEPFLPEEHIARAENLPKALTRFSKAVKRRDMDTKTVAEIHDALDAMLSIYEILYYSEPLSPNPCYLEVMDLVDKVYHFINSLECNPKRF